MPSTYTCLNTVNIVQTAKGMKPLLGVGGVPNQPGLELCNNTLQELLSAPYNWRFNKFLIPPFTTVAYQQDYIVSGCTVTCKGRYILSLNSTQSTTPGLTEAATTVTATFSDFAPTGLPSGQGPNVGDTITIAGASQAGYNITTTITAVPSSTSLQYTAAGGLTNDGGQGISNINWMEHVSLQDWQSTATVIPVHDAEIAASLPLESIIQPPMKFAYQLDKVFGSGITAVTCPLMRAWPVPSSQVWAVNLFFQAKAPTIASLNSTWTPWPDDLSYVLTAMLKAKALDWWEDPRFAASYTVAQQSVLKALGSKDQELRHEALFPDLPILRGG